MVAVGDGGLRPSDHARPVAQLIPCETGKACAIVLVEAFAGGVYSLALACVEEEAERAFDAGIAVEGVAVGVEAVGEYSGQAGILDEAEAGVAAEARAVGDIVGIAVGVHWLTDILSVEVVSRRAGNAPALLVGLAADVADDYALLHGKHQQEG